MDRLDQEQGLHRRLLVGGGRLFVNDWSAGGGDASTVEKDLSLVETIVSNAYSFVAIKRSNLDAPLPPGCSFWKYSGGRTALFFSPHSEGIATGQCSQKHRCICACQTTFEGEVNSSVPGAFSLRISSGQLQCKGKELERLECNENKGYERAWDNVKKRVCCDGGCNA